MKMCYAIVANPASGGKSLNRKRLLLGEAAKILGANIQGLDARNPEEFNDCVVRTARECDVLVAAGGDGTLSVVVKHPFLGFGMKVVPRASLDDGLLHILAVNSGFWKLILWGAATLVFQNPGGRYHTGKRVQAVFERPCSLQADGEECWRAQTFGFEILKGAIMIKS